MLYYTDSELDPVIADTCRGQLLRAIPDGAHLVSVSRKPLVFGDNLVVDQPRGALTMFEQILTGLEALDTERVFFCEHDVLYHPSHFLLSETGNDRVFYNMNVWKLNCETGHAVTYQTKQTSGLSGSRDLLLAHYRTRVQDVKAHGFSRAMGFEPGTRKAHGFGGEAYDSSCPNVDLRHGKNLTQSRWHPSQFRSPRSCQGWREADEIVGWGVTRNRVQEFLREVRRHGEVR